MDSESNESLEKDVSKSEEDISETKCEKVILVEQDEPRVEPVVSVRLTDLDLDEEKSMSKNTAENVSLDETEASVNVPSKTSPEGKENLNNEMDESNLHYEDGICIYTEPESKCQFTWDEEKQEWVPRVAPASFSDKDYEYDGKTYTYTDKDTNIKYRWNEEKKDWEVSDSNNTDAKQQQSEEERSKMKNPEEISNSDITQGCYSFENDTHIYTDPSDGSKYFWDKEKSAWFPRVDDDFLARYQMNYGFVDPNADDPKSEEKKVEPPPKEAEKRKAPQEPAWFEVGEGETTKVYVSGLPLDITESEFVEVMQKCGLVEKDLDTNKMKVKIYLDPETSLPKGDALCTYIKRESVELALELLDGSDVRGHRIAVERAKFTMKGQYDPTLKPKKRRRKDKDKMKKIQEKLFAWMPDKLRGERSKHEKIVIVKNLFTPEMFDRDVKLILEYQQDLRDECLKCGAVKKVVIFDRHPEGVAQISFKEFEAADACVQLLNGRWFGQRKITAELWDGKTKYKITETDEEIKARLAKWEKFLEAGETEEKGESKKPETKIEGEKPDKEKPDEEIEKPEEESEKPDEESESDKMDSENIHRDSDGDTRSSVGSDYDTDDEAKT